MKQLITIIMSYMLFMNCLAFEESPLDPNSPLSALLNLQRLLGRNSNTQLQTTIRMEIKNSNGDAYNGNNIQFGRPEGSGNTRLTSLSKNLSSSTSISNGIVEVALVGLGIFEFRILNIDQEVIAVFQLNITEGLSDENKDSLVPIIISGDLVITILSIKQEFVQLRDTFISSFEGMGERSGNIYALALIETRNSATQSKRLAVLKSSDGLNFNPIYFPGDQFTYEFVNGGESFSNVLFFPTNIIQTGPSSFFFLMQNVATADPSNPPTYGVVMDDSNITSVYQVDKRSAEPNVEYLDTNKIFFINNQLLYAERNTNNGTVEFRLDDNLLNSGSNNFLATLANFAQPSAYNSSDYVFEHKNGIVYNRNQNMSIAAYPINTFAAEYSLTYSGGELPNVLQAVFTAGKNSIYYLEQAGSPPEPYTVKLTNIESSISIFIESFNSTNIFSSTINSEVPINFYSRVMEFGDVHAIYAFENFNTGIFVSNTATQTAEYVDLKAKLSLGEFDSVNPKNIMEIGNKLTISRVVFTPGIPPRLIQNESTDGVDWTPNNDVQIQF